MKEEKRGSCHLSSIRGPKREEVTVPDDVNMPTRNCCGEFNMLDELEGLLSIEDEERFDEQPMFKDISWALIGWDEFSVKMEEDDKDEEEGEKIKITERLEECRMKREAIGFWEEEKTISLNLNYQDVLDAWQDRRSPWADQVPDFTAKDCFMGEMPIMEEEKNEREARVLRYKEKRQIRLFSKRIRYHVRKQNAEKRPRLKGRFVKR